MPLKVLVCDDAQLTRRTLKKILEGAGHLVIGEASNGVDCVKRYKELRPDVVFMDIVMPELDGIEAVRQIMSFDKKAKIIMCSSLAQESKAITALKLGARDFVIKPVSADRVLNSIADLKK